ncbi:MAG TPA: heme-binding protein [Nocardioidaceae bacterium]|nr:heme-binding protein [Nocardioidaceae bacterium]
MSISLETADRIVSGAREYAAREGLAPLTVVVLDAGAHVKAVAREDGAAIKRFEIAYGKAHGALALGVGSRALMARAETQAYFVAAATSAIGGHLVPVPGGVLIREADGTLVGAVGISGDASDADEAACVAGIEGAALTAQVA